MSSPVTSLVGSIAEAWSELRVHRTRVLLSLIGVAVSVAAITGVVAAGAIAEQALTEQSDRYQGRTATIQMSVYRSDTVTADDVAQADRVYDTMMARHDIRYSSHVLNAQLPVRFADGTEDVNANAVDPAYAAIHRTRVLHGRFFTEADTRGYAPAIIIDDVSWRRLGSPDLATHPTVPIGPNDVTAVIVGVTRADCDQCSSVDMLYGDLDRAGVTVGGANGGSPMYEAWVPPSAADRLTAALASELKAGLGRGWEVSVNRVDAAATQIGDPLAEVKLVVGGIAGLVLLLGALGLVNISLVTVRYRIREIGIRRSFGATAGRVFFAVMMESVVATIAAGAVGVGLAIAALRNPYVTGIISQGVQDVPGFPVSAAVFGLVVAVGVGALAGLLPAIVAIRIKPIDAIRG